MLLCNVSALQVQLFQSQAQSVSPRQVGFSPCLFGSGRCKGGGVQADLEQQLRGPLCTHGRRWCISLTTQGKRIHAPGGPLAPGDPSPWRPAFVQWRSQGEKEVETSPVTLDWRWNENLASLDKDNICLNISKHLHYIITDSDIIWQCLLSCNLFSL